MLDNKTITFGLVITGLLVAIGLVVWLLFFSKTSSFLSPLGSSLEISKPRSKPLEKLSFENLKKRRAVPSEIVLEELLESTTEYNAYLFSYKSEGRRITGLAHIPKAERKYPVIIQSRGYVDENGYETGEGTRPSAQVYASNGFITLAPDFLGYGDSAPALNNVWENRFSKTVAVVDLIASIPSLPKADPEKIFLWGHSNGGRITLSVLEVTGKDYPAVLWAPVSQFFPYNVLYYTYGADDKGKFLRQQLAGFEKDYDVDKYSIDEYFNWIRAPIQIHQGTADSLVPINWTDNLADELQGLGLEVNYFTYPGADHNLSGAWDLVVQRDIEFFKSFL